MNGNEEIFLSHSVGIRGKPHEPFQVDIDLEECRNLNFTGGTNGINIDNLEMSPIRKFSVINKIVMDTDGKQKSRSPIVAFSNKNGVDTDDKHDCQSHSGSSVERNELDNDGEHDYQTEVLSFIDKLVVVVDDGEHDCSSGNKQGADFEDKQAHRIPEVPSGHVEFGQSLEEESSIYMVPKLGMEYESEHHAYKCYNRYAAMEGFSIRKDFVNKNRVSGLVVSRRYTCYKQGYRPTKRETNVKKPQKDTRTGCLAHMTIARQPNGKYCVTHFETKHNHEFATPYTAHLLQSQRRISFAQAVEVESAYNSVTDGVPKLGMGFDSEDHAYEFYKAYAGLVGFSVRKDYLNRSKIDGVVASRRFTCFREGFRHKDKWDSNVKKPRKDTRIGCLAQLVIARQPDGKYRATHFEENHNHELVPASRVGMLRSQRRSAFVQSVESSDQVDSLIQPKSVSKLICALSQDRKHLTFNPIDYRSNLSSKRMRDMKEGEAEVILQYFQSKQLKDPSFFYAVQLDAEEQMTNVFWADAKMLVDYGDFGDVVCFDTTYTLDKDCRPFARFIGVNHHKQMVIFAAALLYDKTIESFKWLFRTFVDGMSGKKPQTILTDQDGVMAEAVSLELSDTLHRLCARHVYYKALGYLSEELLSTGSLASDLSHCIFHHDEEEDFINAWKVMLDKYTLWENECLHEIFREREKWATPYGRHIFCADINGAQFCEGFNTNLKKYLKLEINVLQFFKQFGRVVNDYQYKELEANYEMSQHMPRLMGEVILLKHARDVYTPIIFELFQQEYENCLNVIVKQHIESVSIFEYKVSIYGQLREYTVTYNLSEDSVVCKCMKFQFVGILCSHALKVLDYRNIKVVPPRYILKRWTKDARV